MRSVPINLCFNPLSGKWFRKENLVAIPVPNPDSVSIPSRGSGLGKSALSSINFVLATGFNPLSGKWFRKVKVHAAVPLSLGFNPLSGKWFRKDSES